MLVFAECHYFAYINYATIPSSAVLKHSFLIIDIEHRAIVFLHCIGTRRNYKLFQAIKYKKKIACRHHKLV